MLNQRYTIWNNGDLVIILVGTVNNGVLTTDDGKTIIKAYTNGTLGKLVLLVKITTIVMMD